MKRMLACLIAFLGTFAVTTAQQKEYIGPRHLPGNGVADWAGKIGFFPSTADGIDAVELASGKLRWTTKQATHVLLATEDRLYAWTGIKDKPNQLRVVVLDMDGTPKLQSEPIKLADWVHVGVEYGRSFRASGRVDDKVLSLSWQANSWYAGGADPTPEREKAEKREASGVMRVELKSGKAELLDPKNILAKGLLPVPSHATGAILGALMFCEKDTPTNNPQKPLEVRRSVSAADLGGKLVWQREVRSPVRLPLRK